MCNKCVDRIVHSLHLPSKENCLARFNLQANEEPTDMFSTSVYVIRCINVAYVYVGLSVSVEALESSQQEVVTLLLTRRGR